MNTTQIWFKDGQELIRCPSITQIWPQSHMHCNEKLNAIVRLSVCIAIVLRMFGVSAYIFCLPIIALLATWIAYEFNTQNDQHANDVKEPFTLFEDAVQHQTHPNAPDTLQHEYPPSPYDRVNTIGAPRQPAPETPQTSFNRSCRLSTITNPFSNTLVTDMQHVLPPACNRQDNPYHKDNVKHNFEATLNKSAVDVYDKHASQRQYFTMPYTQGFPDPNNDFPSWLYDTPPILKEQVMFQSPPLNPS